MATSGRKLKEGFERHVFITHCEADNEFAKNLYRKLQAKGFQCGMASQDFMGGVQIFDQIITFIETSEKILSLISRQSLKSYWCTLELSLTLERSIDNDRLAIVPVLLDVETKELPDVLRQLECIDGKVDGFLDDVMNMIIGPDVSVESLLPVGNVGHGFAWSYYNSFLKIVLPSLNERIQQCPHWQSDPKRRCIPRRMYLLLPESCKCPGKLTDWDKRIVADTPLKPMKRWRAGKERTYKNSVYKIQDDKTFYFLGEFCSVVQPMNDMEVGGIARMSADEKKRQLYRFKCTLEDILGYYHSNKYRLILYNDTDGNIDDGRVSQELLKLIREDIRADIEAEKLNACEPSYQRQNTCQDSSQNDEFAMETGNGGVGMETENGDVTMEIDHHPKTGEPEASRSLGFNEHWKYHAFIMYGEGEEDRKFAIALTNFLEKEKHMKCAVKDRDLSANKQMLEEMREMTRRSKRTILILSDETSENVLTIFHMLRVPNKDELEQSVQPIPVLRGTPKAKYIHDFCKNLTYVQSKEENYKEQLFQALTVEVKVPRLPAGNVAEGFVWSYFYNYLKKVLPDLKRRMEHSDWYSEYSRTISHKMFVFMPDSGRMLERLEAIPGVNLVGTVNCERDEAGNIKRSYDSTVYSVQDTENGQAYYFVGEYLTPLAVIQDMESGQEAGLSTDAHAKQVSWLYRRLEEILNHEHAHELKGTWRLFRHDNSPKKTSDISRQLVELIKEDIEEDSA